MRDQTCSQDWETIVLKNKFQDQQRIKIYNIQINAKKMKMK